MKFTIAAVLIISFITGHYGAQQYDRHENNEVTQINSVHFGWGRNCWLLC